jgi:hypothetical protein
MRLVVISVGRIITPIEKSHDLPFGKKFTGLTVACQNKNRGDSWAFEVVAARLDCLSI